MVIYAFLLLIVSLLSLTLAKYYGSLQVNELRRVAKTTKSYKPLLIIAKNKDVAVFLFRFLALISYSLGLVFLVFGRSRWFIFEVVAISILLIILFSNFYMKLAFFGNMISPKVSIVVSKLGFIKKVTAKINQLFVYNSVSKIYNEHDLMVELKNQVARRHNRIPEAKLALMASVLSFTELTVQDLMRSKKDTVFIDYEETISTVLMDELHKSDQKYFPVYKDKKSQIVGVMNLDDLIEKRMSGKVAWMMSENVLEISQDQLVTEILNQYIASKNGLFVVKDGQKLVGILLADDLLNRLLV